MTFLHHTTVAVTPDKFFDVVEFYKHTICLNQIPSQVGGTAWFSEGLHVYPTSEAKPLDGGGAHIAFIVGPRFDTVRRLSIMEGWHLGDLTPYWGSPRAFVEDPAGNRLEIMEAGPPAPL